MPVAAAGGAVLLTVSLRLSLPNVAYPLLTAAAAALVWFAASTSERVRLDQLRAGGYPGADRAAARARAEAAPARAQLEGGRASRRDRRPRRRTARGARHGRLPVGRQFDPSIDGKHGSHAVGGVHGFAAAPAPATRRR